MQHFSYIYVPTDELVTDKLCLMYVVIKLRTNILILISCDWLCQLMQLVTTGIGSTITVCVCGGWGWGGGYMQTVKTIVFKASKLDRTQIYEYSTLLLTIVLPVLVLVIGN